MVNNINWISIKIILDRILRHPLLQDLSLEAAVQYTCDFIGVMGLPATFIDKYEEVEIENYRAFLPCDLVSIIQVKETKSNKSLRGNTDSFYLKNTDERRVIKSDNTFKVQGNIIYTSFKDGTIGIAYKATLLDKDGYPLIPDNPIFLRTLESYIKKEYFTILFDLNKISPNTLNNTQQEYAFRAGQCNNEFIIPSISEMESISNILNQLIPRTNEFNSGFKSLGAREYIKDLR